MRIVSTRVHRFDLPLRRPHVTGAGTIRARRGFILELVDDRGLSGFGEAAPLWGRGEGGLEPVAAELASIAAAARGASDRELSELRVASPIVAAALDTAVLDLRGRRDDRPVARLLTETPASGLAVNALVSAVEPDDVVAGVGAAVEAGFGTVKLKVAAAGPDADVERVRLAREAAGDDVVLRLDANRAWELPDAIDVLGRVERYGIDYVEEPVASLTDAATLRRRTGIALAADESIASGGESIASGGERIALAADDLDAILATGAFDVAVLKPSLLGGPTATVGLARRLAEAGVGVVVSSALDAAIGLSAALHTAAAIDHRGAAGLATSDLLASDVAAPPTIERGVMAVPDAAGLGVGPLLI